MSTEWKECTFSSIHDNKEKASLSIKKNKICNDKTRDVPQALITKEKCLCVKDYRNWTCEVFPSLTVS